MLTGPDLQAGHPRVGGEQLAHARAFWNKHGSSPRGRGTDVAHCVGLRVVRVIPAWAGNSSGCATRPVRAAGHPRVGGEQSVGLAAAQTLGGSSPRGRGTDRAADSKADEPRVIPAWAGNRRSTTGCSSPQPGHPRVGGEQSSPHAMRLSPSGSSPRGRGTVFPRERDHVRPRVIPAWAGNSAPSAISTVRVSGHPRVGGEQDPSRVIVPSRNGSSPRGRGTVALDRPECLDGRVIPAWAGNRDAPYVAGHPRPGHPRVGGEQRIFRAAAVIHIGSSPRGRGTDNADRVRRERHRVIPAWAGNSLSPSLTVFPPTGHPRVGGEQWIAPPR